MRAQCTQARPTTAQPRVLRRVGAVGGEPGCAPGAAPAATPPGPAARRAWAPWALLAALLVGGCSSALWRDVRYDAGQDATTRRLATVEGADKASVLAELGPPGEVLGLAAGDIFVYRLRTSDLDTWQLNTGLVSSVSMSVYAHVSGIREDVTLFVFFDAEGRVTHVSTSWNGLGAAGDAGGGNASGEQRGDGEAEGGAQAGEAGGTAGAGGGR